MRKSCKHRIDGFVPPQNTQPLHRWKPKLSTWSTTLPAIYQHLIYDLDRICFDLFVRSINSSTRDPWQRNVLWHRPTRYLHAWRVRLQIQDNSRSRISLSEISRIERSLVRTHYILADRTNGRAYATVLRPSYVVVVSVCDVMCCIM